MQTLSQTGLERIQYKEGINNSRLSLANVYGDIQEKYGDALGQAMQEDEVNWKEFLQNNTGDKLLASGRTGRSVGRTMSMDLAEYLRKGSRKAYELTEVREELSEAGAKAAAQSKAEQMQLFAKNSVIKNPDFAPPPPVMQSVSAAAFMDAVSIAGAVGGAASGVAALSNPSSDRRLKENIIKLGESISGLGIYKFNYIGKAKQYIGAMADEVIKIFPKAAILNSNGFYSVDYSLIDVNFKEV